MRTVSPPPARQDRPGLHRLARNCVVPTDVADDLAARCAAAIGSCADDPVVVLETAARIQGLWLPEVDDVIHLATATPNCQSEAMTRTRRPQFIAHRWELPSTDISAMSGLPITTVSRTWRDLASVLRLADLVAAGESALRSGVSPDELSDVVRRTARSRGVRRAREALSLLDARSRSRPESHLRVAVAATDLPAFAVNEPVYRRSGGWLGEPDLALIQAKIALEYQGKDHADEDRMRKDMTRAKDFRSEGWAMFFYGPAEVFKRPWEIRAEVRQAIRERAPHLFHSRRLATYTPTGHL